MNTASSSRIHQPISFYYTKFPTFHQAPCTCHRNLGLQAIGWFAEGTLCALSALPMGYCRRRGLSPPYALGKPGKTTKKSWCPETFPTALPPAALVALDTERKNFRENKKKQCVLKHSPLTLSLHCTLRGNPELSLHCQGWDTLNSRQLALEAGSLHSRH